MIIWNFFWLWGNNLARPVCEIPLLFSVLQLFSFQKSFLVCLISCFLIGVSRVTLIYTQALSIHDLLYVCFTVHENISFISIFSFLFDEFVEFWLCNLFFISFSERHCVCPQIYIMVNIVVTTVFWCNRGIC